MPEEETFETEEKTKRSRTIGLWILNGVGALILYFAVYPFPLLYLDNPNGIDIESKLPDWAYSAIGISAYPLAWLNQNYEPYRAYIEWIDRIVAT